MERWFTPVGSQEHSRPEWQESNTPSRILSWLLGPARAVGKSSELWHELSWRLVAAGLPLARTTLHMGTLHPQFLGTFCRWERAAGRTVEGMIAHGVRETSAYLQSPLRIVFESGAIVRRRLDSPEAAAEFPILQELEAVGVTDYVATPLLFSHDRMAAATFATDRPSGFTDAEIVQIESMLPILALVIEVQSTRRIAASLLDIYLGRQTGQRVLNGAIRRGSGETIRAVLFYSDMRDFTSLSNSLPGAEVIALLNAYFERLVAPIHAQQGEVLKFIGDGLLAIFPIEDAAFAFNAARRALEAALTACDEIDAFNASPARERVPPMRMALALHVGDVIYGNIGGEDRLDFTAIGPAVNLVSRLEQLSKPLGCRVLLSDDFARICERPLVSLGSHVVRGVPQPHEVFTLAG